MKTIGVLGTFVWDEIWHPALGPAQPLTQWGGLTYSLSAFGAADPSGTLIHPLARVGSDLADAAFRFVSQLPCIGSTRGLKVVDEPNNRVELRYQDQADRLERLTGGVAGWELDDLLPLVGQLDALYLNFLAGNELDLSTAVALRAAVEIPIYADLHSLFLGPPGDGARQPRRLDDWECWLSCFDIVQMNETELGLLGSARPDPFALLPDLPGFGPKIVLITHGAGGATAAVRTGGTGILSDGETQSEVEIIHFPLGELVDGDPTGCGDVWGSVCFCGLIEGRSLEAAVQRAHAAAGAKMKVREINGITPAVATSLRPSSAPA